jgi:hypothetical protein
MLTTNYNSEKSLDIETILMAGIATLDLTDKQYERAVKEYKAIAAHLAARTSFFEKHFPDIYPQGSMDLGTCLRPFGRIEFDLDIVVVMYGSSYMTLEETMNELGNALKGFPTGNVTIERLDRCFRVNYPGDFHIDLLPARPDASPSNPTAIKLPDCKSLRWGSSDPKSFKGFFEESKGRVIVEAREFETVINAKKADVAPPPKKTTIRNKTVLQFSIQILKRHRDLYFNDRKDATSSAVITSLASQAYLGHQHIEQAVSSILARIGSFVRPEKPRVPNPRYSQEDYADRWTSIPPHREVAFWEWLHKAKIDFASLANLELRSAINSLEPILGKEAASSALKTFDSEGISKLRASGSLALNKTTGFLVAATAVGTTPVKGTSFFGNEPF